jgi:hypothetical protein
VIIPPMAPAPKMQNFGEVRVKRSINQPKRIP